MPRDFHSREGIDEWLQSLDDRWPARAEVSKHIVAEISKRYPPSTRTWSN